MHRFLIAFSLIFSATLLQAKCDSHAKKLVTTYPQLSSCKNNTILWRDGSNMLYDDGKKETFEKILTQADIEDMFTHSYRDGRYSNPPKNYDPGRYRNDKFFRKMYGNSARAVKKHLTTIHWFGQNVPYRTKSFFS